MSSRSHDTKPEVTRARGRSRSAKHELEAAELASPGTSPGAKEKLTPEMIVMLQRTAGNQAVQKLMAQRTMAGRQAAIQRSLQGTHSVLISEGGDASFKSKITGGKWSKILDEIKKYEKFETELFELRAQKRTLKNQIAASAKSVFGSHRAEAQRPQTNKDYTDLMAKIEKLYGKMSPILTSLEAMGQQWIEENTAVPDQSVSDKKRLSTLRMVVPRFTWERQQLRVEDREIYNTESEQSSEGGADHGDVNQVDKVTYKSGTKGFYKKDIAQVEVQPEQEEAIGIDKNDPQYNARSVAMYALDQLLGTNLLVKADFATHTSQTEQGPLKTLGIYMAEAEGNQLRKQLMPGKGQFTREPGVNLLSLDDPTLQRALNKLQLLDILAGQVDRHMGNVFVQQNEAGNVTGISGIDNDMAFGKGQTELGKIRAEDGRDKAPSYKGLPALVDEEMRTKLLAPGLTDRVRDVLTGLLPAADIAATLSRLTKLRTYLQGLEQQKIIGAGGWNQQTALAQNSENSYLGEARKELYGVLLGSEVSAYLKTKMTEHNFTTFNFFLQRCGEAIRVAVTKYRLAPTVDDGKRLIDAVVAEMDRQIARDEKTRKDFSGIEPIFKQIVPTVAQQVLGAQQQQQQQAAV